MTKVLTGLDQLITSKDWQNKLGQNIGYLCHSASVDSNIQIGIIGLKKVLGNRLKCLFSPQHGLVSNVQDNMVESTHYHDSYFDLKVYSLYSETRIPTDEMLTGLDTVLIDLQDVGTRIYTYIYTMTLMMKKCSELGIKVVILDRPNPINGIEIEGNILEMEYSSFVGLHPIPVRHAMTSAEIALMANKLWQKECELEIIPMQGWKRTMSFEDTGLPWVMPSPNLPTIEAAYTFVGTVLFEGTNISEGRGTTRSLEIIGHPKLEPYGVLDRMSKQFADFDLQGFVLRPVGFQPTFQKHAGIPCGGYQIHVTDRSKFRPWRLAQFLLREFIHELGSDFAFKEPGYEYDYTNNPLDLINGNNTLRDWALKRGSFDELRKIENKNTQEFLSERDNFLLYN